MDEAAKPKHESWQRLMEAARESKVIGPAAVAAVFGESEQTVTNWGTRGVSKAGAIKAQQHFGCTASWILNGSLPQWLTTPPASDGNKPQAAANEETVFTRMTDAERDVLNDIRDLTDEDRAEFVTMIKRRADIQRRHWAKNWPPNIPMPRRYAAFLPSERATLKITPRLRQQSLLEEPNASFDDDGQ